MANRSYLYSLSNRPGSYADRPDTISGLSEWNYAVPFSFRVLMSGEPRLCASLVSDGFETDPPGRKTRLHAICGDFEMGFARFKRCCAVVDAAAPTSPELRGALKESLDFLEAHRDRYLLLETIELDCLSEETEAGLRTCIERELEVCHRVGEAVDALPCDVEEAATALKAAAAHKQEAPLDAFHGLVLDDNFDNLHDGKTDNPIGLSWWTDVLYFALWNKAEFEANQ